MASRKQHARQAQLLREREGLNYREIGYRLGLSRSYVSTLFSDPDGSKDRARKESYGGTCGSCGGPTYGGSGRAKAPKFCAQCAGRAYAKWNRERVIEAIREWARRTGYAPTAGQWGANDGVHELPYAHDGYQFPWFNTVMFHFGGRWSDAIEAAGFPRPTNDRNYNKEPWRVENMTNVRVARPYLIFKLDEQNRLELYAEVDAIDSVTALEDLVTEPGRYAVVAKASLTEYSLQAKLSATRAGRVEA